MYNLRSGRKRRPLDGRDQTRNLPAAKKQKLRPQASLTPTRYQACSSRVAVTKVDRNNEVSPRTSLEHRVLGWLGDVPQGKKSWKQESYEESHEETADAAQVSNMPNPLHQSMPPPPTPPLTLGLRRRRIRRVGIGEDVPMRSRRGKRASQPGGRKKDQGTKAGPNVRSSISIDGTTTISRQQSSSSISRATSGPGRTGEPLYYQLVLNPCNIQIITSIESHEVPVTVSDHLKDLRALCRLPGLSPEFTKSFVKILAQLRRSDDEAALSELIATILPSKSVNLGSSLTAQEIGNDPGTYLSSVAGLTYTLQALLVRHLVPPLVVTPKPDRIYGYSRQPHETVFSQTQLTTQLRLKDSSGNPLAIANSKGLCFPFFVIELKGQGRNWVAENQIAGGCFACLRSVQSINEALATIKSRNAPAASRGRGRGRSRIHGRTKRSVQTQSPTFSLVVDNFVYGLTVDNTVAQLYIAWYCMDAEQGEGCKILEVEEFVLKRENELNLLWARIRFILDWGKGTRLQQVRDALDIIEAARFVM